VKYFCEAGKYQLKEKEQVAECVMEGKTPTWRSSAKIACVPSKRMFS